MLIENVEVFGFRPAIRGMRNSYDSWNKSDSKFQDDFGYLNSVGEKDLKLASILIKRGDEEGKLTRMIQVWVDMTLPLYLYSELDTYKVGVTKNSCSTMHSICKNYLNVASFENEMVNENVLDYLNSLIKMYKRSNIKEEKNELLIKIKSHLPSSYLLKSTINTNYQVLRRIYFQRRNHKLPQWNTICDWIKSLPYSSELIIVE